METNQLKAMLADTEAELRVAEERVLHLRQIVSGLRGLLTPLGTVGGSSSVGTGASVTVRPSAGQATIAGGSATIVTTGPVYDRPVEAVKRILSANPNRPLTMVELWRRVQQDGRLDPNLRAPRNAVDAAVRRLADDPNEPMYKRLLPSGEYIYSTTLTVAGTFAVLASEARAAGGES